VICGHVSRQKRKNDQALTESLIAKQQSEIFNQLSIHATTNQCGLNNDQLYTFYTSHLRSEHDIGMSRQLLSALQVRIMT